MDYLRACYRVQMRLVADSDTLYWVKWFFAPKGAKVFPYINRTWSAVWRTDHTQELEGIGEASEDRTWRPGTNPGDYCGKVFTGDPEWFRTGVPSEELDKPDPPPTAGCKCRKGGTASGGTGIGVAIPPPPLPDLSCDCAGFTFPATLQAVLSSSFGPLDNLIVTLTRVGTSPLDYAYSAHVTFPGCFLSTLSVELSCHQPPFTDYQGWRIHVGLALPLGNAYSADAFQQSREVSRTCLPTFSAQSVRKNWSKFLVTGSFPASACNPGSADWVSVRVGVPVVVTEAGTGGTASAGAGILAREYVGTGGSEGGGTGATGRGYLGTDGSESAGLGATGRGYLGTGGSESGGTGLEIHGAGTEIQMGLLFARVKRAALLTVATTTDVLIPWDTVESDPHGFWSVSHPTRLTAPVAGLYLLNTSLLWNSLPATTLFHMTIYKNGSPYKMLYQTTAGGVTVLGQGGPALIEMAAGDYLEVGIWQQSGANRNTWVDGFTDHWAEMVWLGTTS